MGNTKVRPMCEILLGQILRIGTPDQILLSNHIQGYWGLRDVFYPEITGNGFGE